jgi:hypothetical protein
MENTKETRQYQVAEIQLTYNDELMALENPVLADELNNSLANTSGEGPVSTTFWCTTR